ncbi:MAG: diaminobutyrate--2-oxoglutarate transaminase [Nitrospinota bacterium]|nr:diaminobutyrate--2-oxoglutarate transaminase [Nitrospinota bacterium]
MELNVFKEKESNIRSYCRSFPILFNRAKGAFLYDDKGKKYLDFLSGAGTLNYGHNNPSIKDAVMAYLERDGIVHGLDMHTTAKKDFIETLEKLILKPRGLDYKIQFTGPTGTNAVEAAFKLARKVTGRKTIVSFTNGFHGVSLGSLAATGNSHFRNASGVELSNVMFMPYDQFLGEQVDTIDVFRRYLADSSSGLGLPAAVIVETIQGEGGANVASEKWLKDLRQLCDENNMLLIVDDIQAGVGRAGAFFSFESAGIVPDMVLLSKSLGGMGLPLSIVLLKPELDKWKPGEHNGTFRGNNLAFVAATEMIRKYWSDNAFQKSIMEKADYISKRLEKISGEHPGKVIRKGRGLLQGLEFANAENAGKVARASLKDGLIIETSGTGDAVVKLLPPLIIDHHLLEEGIDILHDAVSSVLGAPRQDNVVHRSSLVGEAR